MIIKTETTLADFRAWSGARYTLDRLIEEDACNTMEQVLEDLYPDGLTDTELNDILWFEPDWCFEMCGISTDEEDDE